MKLCVKQKTFNMRQIGRIERVSTSAKLKSRA